MKTKFFNGRKIVKASTENGLQKKIAESEKRNWQVVGQIKQHKVGQWCCLMELPSKKKVIDG